LTNLSSKQVSQIIYGLNPLLSDGFGYSAISIYKYSQVFDSVAVFA